MTSMLEATKHFDGIINETTLQIFSGNRQVKMKDYKKGKRGWARIDEMTEMHRLRFVTAEEASMHGATDALRKSACMIAKMADKNSQFERVFCKHKRRMCVVPLEDENK